MPQARSAVEAELDRLARIADEVHRIGAPVPSVSSDFHEHQPESHTAKVLEDIRAQIQRGAPIDTPPLKFIGTIIDAIAAANHLTTGLDDRKLALEDAITLLSRAPNGPETSSLMGAAIRLLYTDLPHPPSTSLGESWQFRSADGSGNSRVDPNLGKAGTPYSRSCSSATSLPYSHLPDPGLVFDLLIKRDKFVPHPAGLSGTFFYFATFLIHQIFRTSRTDWNINETSSYFDLGILYGNDQAHQDKMRVVDGRGRILPDCLAETRLANLPPGVTALVICFNRNHNWLCEMLLSINDGDKWNQDLEILLRVGGLKAIEKQDYEIFNTARLVNCLTFANVILGDYLAAILGTVRDLSSWTLDIAGERRQKDHTLLERGAGNSCSIEFNTLYRWHSALSQEDEQWSEQQFKYLFNTEDWDSLTPETFEAQIAVKFSAMTPGEEPLTLQEYYSLSPDERDRMAYESDAAPRDYLKLPFGRNKRDPQTQRYDDDVLANALLDATSVPAGAFKARGVPHVLRVIEIMGIEQSRKWGCCTLNDFRRFLDLKPYTTFEEWNPNQAIADAAKKLYRNVENLELYVGLISEETKEVGPGSGLCPSYTMSRAILADATAIFRGDRYLTYDCTPFNLTPFGFTEGSRNVHNAAHGGMLGRVIQRALPNHYDAESVYTHFPFITPTGQPHSMDNTLRKLGRLEKYSIARPVKQSPVLVITSGASIREVLGDAFSTDRTAFVSVYSKNIADLKLDRSFLDFIDDPVQFRISTSILKEVVLPTSEGMRSTRTWFHDRTLGLVIEKSVGISGRTHMVDLVRDVVHLLPIHWSSTQVAGLPLKTNYEPRGVFYEQQMFAMLKGIYSFIYTEVDATLKIPLRETAKENAKTLLRSIHIALEEAKGGVAGHALSAGAHIIQHDRHNHDSPILRRLLALGAPIQKTAEDVLGLIATLSIELSQIFAHIINFYLAPTQPPVHSADPQRLNKEWEEYEAKSLLQATISSLAADDSHESWTQLQGFAREALRLDPAISGVYRKARHSCVLNGIYISEGQRVYCDLRAIAADPDIFPHPDTVSPDRPDILYELLHGDGAFAILGEGFVYGTAASVLRAVFSLKNVRRAPGPTGKLLRFKETVHAPCDVVIPLGDGYIYTRGQGPRAQKWSYLDPDDANRVTNWATGLSVFYDD